MGEWARRSWADRASLTLRLEAKPQSVFVRTKRKETASRELPADPLIDCQLRSGPVTLSRGFIYVSLAGGRVIACQEARTSRLLGQLGCIIF